jgi:segregation and condensation protein B
MDETEIKHVVEAALLAAGRPLTLDRLVELFVARGGGPDRAAIKRVIDALVSDYQGRGIEIKEVASGYRVQVKGTMTDWLQPLWEERAPRYTRALLETLALVAYRQPITRAEIEEVRGVTVNPDIVRTLFERNWIRVVGHREVPGRPELLGTTREFLDYFALKSLDDLPSLAELRDMDNLGVQLELPGQEGEAQPLDTTLKADAADDDGFSATAEDDGADDEESGSGTPQMPGMVARRSDD